MEYYILFYYFLAGNLSNNGNFALTSGDSNEEVPKLFSDKVFDFNSSNILARFQNVHILQITSFDNFVLQGVVMKVHAGSRAILVEILPEMVNLNNLI